MTESTTPMPSSAPPSVELPLFERIYVWEFPIRIVHWVNALSLTVLFATGLYIAHPVLSSSGEAWDSFVMGRVRQIHFATAYVFTAALLLRFAWLVLGNQYSRSGIPRPWRSQWWKSFLNQAFQYLKLDAGRPHLGHNALAGLGAIRLVLLVVSAEISKSRSS